jgi:hypothetical protein
MVLPRRGTAEGLEPAFHQGPDPTVHRQTSIEDEIDDLPLARLIRDRLVDRR